MKYGIIQRIGGDMLIALLGLVVFELYMLIAFFLMIPSEDYLGMPAKDAIIWPVALWRTR